MTQTSPTGSSFQKNASKHANVMHIKARRLVKEKRLTPHQSICTAALTQELDTTIHLQIYYMFIRLNKNQNF